MNMLTIWGVPDIPEVGPGDDLAGLIGDAIDAMARTGPGAALVAGDILVVSSKIVSKAEGRHAPFAQRERVIDQDSVRLVAARDHPDGTTRIVETAHGLVMAAAGIDTSNVPEGQVLRLPADPDASALALNANLRQRYGVDLGVILSDTFGRPWRIGLTDQAIGAAGLDLVDDLRGTADANGRVLFSTIVALGDELAAAADLVKGKKSGMPVAVVRGLGRLVTGLDAPGARSLQRPANEDMFRLGTDEAYRQGLEEGAAIRQTETHWVLP